MLRIKSHSLRENVMARLAEAAKPPETPASRTLRLTKLRIEREQLTLELLKQLEYANLAQFFVREYVFHPERKWRLDLYAQMMRLGVELHGGIWTQGRHVRGLGFAEDRVKINAAIEQGISVLEYTQAVISDGSALAQIERIFASKRFMP
jgi:hypothetical protein